MKINANLSTTELASQLAHICVVFLRKFFRKHIHVRTLDAFQKYSLTYCVKLWMRLTQRHRLLRWENRVRTRCYHGSTHQTTWALVSQVRCLSCNAECRCCWSGYHQIVFFQKSARKFVLSAIWWSIYLVELWIWWVMIQTELISNQIHFHQQKQPLIRLRL